jgi:hypothetical protein
MIKKFIKAAAVLLFSTMVITACNMPGSANTNAIATSPPATQAPNTLPPTANQHQIIPMNLPAERSNHAGDYDSSTTASGKRSAGGDRFTYEQFERPFNANTMDVYFPYLDILDTTSYQDDTWIYGTILLKGRENDKLPGKYGFQLDMDLDGKGDWMVFVSNPSSTEWTTDGVQVFQDANHDVGAVTAMFTDKNAVSDGFETKVFDSGEGNDHDAAWARISPDNPHMVEIALKRSLVGSDDKTYMMNMWAGNALMNPALFDLSDHFTHEQAGAADPGFEIYYPIKAVSEIDNSCRMPIGFAPTGKEPGLCREFNPRPEPQPGAPTCPYSCPFGQLPYPDCRCIPG